MRAKTETTLGADDDSEAKEASEAGVVGDTAAAVPSRQPEEVGWSAPALAPAPAPAASAAAAATAAAAVALPALPL
eukprot:scaffold131423_cov39-Phaeocystis_antarctica.AAC.2